MAKLAPDGGLGRRDDVRRLIAALFLVPCLTGPLSACVNRAVYETPYFKSRVIDAKSGEGITGALITVWSEEDRTKSATGKSDAAGNIFIPPIVREATVFGPWDSFPPHGTAKIESPGYLSKEVEVAAGISDTPDISLMPNK